MISCSELKLSIEKSAVMDLNTLPMQLSLRPWLTRDREATEAGSRRLRISRKTSKGRFSSLERTAGITYERGRVTLDTGERADKKVAILDGGR